jgi:hypothetical protein
VRLVSIASGFAIVGSHVAKFGARRAAVAYLRRPRRAPSERIGGASGSQGVIFREH